MNNLIPTDYRGFAIHKKNLHAYEESTVLVSASLASIPYVVVSSEKDVKSDMIPVGDIKFIQGVLGYKVKPNYYTFESLLKRNIWYTDEWPLGRKVFIKPADEYKRFTGFVTNGGYRRKKRGPYVCSDVIKVKNEWRYYLGSELEQGFWYAGQDECKDSPALESFGIDFSGLYGCLDMGECEDGSIVLIEYQHAFSCGWYGKGIKDGEKYAKWIAYGYADMVKSKVKE
jgi:hypothetical protein